GDLLPVGDSHADRVAEVARAGEPARVHERGLSPVAHAEPRPAHGDMGGLPGTDGVHRRARGVGDPGLLQARALLAPSPARLHSPPTMGRARGGRFVAAGLSFLLAVAWLQGPPVRAGARPSPTSS